MNEQIHSIDLIHLTELMRDTVIIKLVSIVDVASLSILELLQYNDLTQREINHALSEGVISVDRTTALYQCNNAMIGEGNNLVGGDYYFYNILNSKVKLTELGHYILDSIKGYTLKEPVKNLKNHFDISSYNPLICSFTKNTFFRR